MGYASSRITIRSGKPVIGRVWKRNTKKKSTRTKIHSPVIGFVTYQSDLVVSTWFLTSKKKLRAVWPWPSECTDRFCVFAVGSAECSLPETDSTGRDRFDRRMNVRICTRNGSAQITVNSLYRWKKKTQFLERENWSRPPLT